MPILVRVVAGAGPGPGPDGRGGSGANAEGAKGAARGAAGGGNVSHFAHKLLSGLLVVSALHASSAAPPSGSFSPPCLAPRGLQRWQVLSLPPPTARGHAGVQGWCRGAPRREVPILRDGPGHAQDDTDGRQGGKGGGGNSGIP